MSDLFKKVCPLPWLHFSAHLDSTMRICCNTDGTGFIKDNSGKTIKLSEVKDINEYFNLEHFKKIRSQMMKGEEPEQCRKCYQVEHHGGQSVRQSYLEHYKNRPVFLESFQATSESGEIDAKVTSFDLSLSNKCNLKCIMCSPSASFLIKADYDKLGLPYSKDFTEGAQKNWKDLTHISGIVSQIAPSLHEFLTTGGEPFLNEEHLQIVEKLVESGHAHKIQLSYHTNCMVKNERLFELWNHFRSVAVNLSIDAIGPLNEYIRHWSNWETVVENARLLILHPKARCEIHTTVQALNIFNLHELYEWSETFLGRSELPYHIWMDNPKWLRMDVLPPALLERALKKLESYFSARSEFHGENAKRRDQIISYVKRAKENFQGEAALDDFRKKIRQFEELRNTGAIEDLVPELREVFHQA